jgi:hypothetical protein
MAGEWVKASAAAGDEEGNELGVASEAKAAILRIAVMMATNKAPSRCHHIRARVEARIAEAGPAGPV